MPDAQDRIRVIWAGTGTSSPISLGAPADATFFAPTAALDSKTVSYLIHHQGEGVAEVEWGRGVYTHSGASLTRAEILGSTTGGIGGSIHNFSAGTKHVSITIHASDLQGRFISGLPEATIDSVDDYLMFWDATDAALKKITLPNLELATGAVIDFTQVIPDSLAEIVSPGSTLKIPVWDPEDDPVDSQHYVTLGNLPGGVGGSAPTPTAATVTAASNPYALDATNVADAPVAKYIVADGTTAVIVLELQAAVAVPRTWQIFRSKDHTGRILITGASSSVAIDGIIGVGTTTNVTDAVWAAPSGSSGNITSAGSNLPVYAVGDLFDVPSHPGQAANAGLYVVTASTAGTLGYTKVSGSAPVAAASATVGIRVRGIGAELAAGRASAPLFLVQTNDARFEGEGLQPLTIPNIVAFETAVTLEAGAVVTGPVTLGTGGSISDAGPISASGTLVKATHGGRAVRTTGNVTIPSTSGDVGMGGIIIIGTAGHTISFGASTTAGLAVDDTVTYYVSSTSILLRSIQTWATRLAMS